MSAAVYAGMWSPTFMPGRPSPGASLYMVCRTTAST